MSDANTIYRQTHILLQINDVARSYLEGDRG